VETVSHSTQPISSLPESDDKDLLIKNQVEELKKLTTRIQGVEGSKVIEGLNYEDLCIHPDVKLLERYKPPKFEMFDGTGNARVQLRTYCDKLVGVEKDEKICMKLFMRSLKGDVLSWYIIQDLKKCSNWDRYGIRIHGQIQVQYGKCARYVFYSEFKEETQRNILRICHSLGIKAVKVRPALGEEQMNKFFVRAGFAIL